MVKNISIKAELTFAIICLLLWVTLGTAFFIFTIIFLEPVLPEANILDYIFTCIIISVLYLSVIIALIAYIKDLKRKLSIFSKNKKR